VSSFAEWPARRAQLMNRVHARLAALARPATGIRSQPEPRSIGQFARGRQLAAGNIQFAGHLVASQGRDLWDIDMPGPMFEAEAHGFTWLDDLAAVADAPTRHIAQRWTWGWIDRFGTGRGPGWTADLTGRRLIRLLHHAIMLLHGQDRAASDRFFRSLARQTIFLSKRWKSATPGLPRFEALTGLVYAGLALSGMERHVAGAVAALERECDRQIDAAGGIGTRNPEELLDIFTLLTWVSLALTEAQRPMHPGLLAAIERIAPTLRSLRHADGALARFHGGGRGAPGRLDQALAASGVRPGPIPGAVPGLAMGFARLHGGRTSVIVDASAPPPPALSHNAHASTLGFELTSGRRPLIVSCGSGAGFAAKWRRAARATACHSAPVIEGVSSARLAARGGWVRPAFEALVDAPVTVSPQQAADTDGMRLLVGHDGYAASHGLTVMRRLHLSANGRCLSGEDTLGAMDDAERRSFDRAQDRAQLRGITYTVRFHLHPDVDATVDLGGSAVSMALRSGEIWVFRHDGSAALTLEPSVYFQRDRLKPRAAEQIVLTSRVADYAGQVSWTLAKARETPDYLRDTESDDPLQRT
jgi:uncharacterized heparinase superfamily protein